MKAHLISNVTMQPLLQYLDPLTVCIGDFNSLEELIDESSTAAAPATTHVLCLFDTDALLGDACYGLAEPARPWQFLEFLDAFCERHPEKIIVANTFCIGSNRIANFLEVVQESTLGDLEHALNDRLRRIARERRNLAVVDIEPLFRRYGEEQLVSTVFWYSGRVRFTLLMFRLLAERVKQVLAAYGNKSRKVLVLDLDNTLWGGIVGELGPRGVALSEDGQGACFRDFQRAVKGLKSTGALLAICSKNNPGDVDEIFEKNSMMILSREDFVAIKANWEPKPQNLIDIAASLNLGLDSFVFIDDNPVERGLVASSLPEVAVPDFPERLDALPRWFIDNVVRPYFGRYRLSDEDRAKTQQYRANEARRELSRNLDVDGYLAELGITCRLHIDDPESVVRASQMTQKTNQFNLTTLRCEIPEVERYQKSRDHALIALEYEDRFGSEGIVALSMVDLAQSRIDNFLMSCRVIGRKVEDRLLEGVLEALKGYGAHKAVAEFVPTSKNQQVATFYDAHGFRVVAEEPSGRKLYERTI